MPSTFDIESWRHSLAPSHAVPSSSIPVHSQPHFHHSNSTSTSSSNSSAESKTRAPPSLHVPQPRSNLSADTSSAGEDTDASSGSETESQKAIRSSKKEEADRLVDSTLSLLLSVWPASPASCPLNGAGDETVPLRTFVNEILRRSRSSCAALRAAKWYLERASVLLPPAAERTSPLVCARRTFLSALILANKFMHDRVYSNRAWSRVSGLAVTEVSKGEAALGNLLSWSLWIGRSESNDVSPAREAHLALCAPPLIPVPPTPITTSSTLNSSSSSSSQSSSSSPASSVLESPGPVTAASSAPIKNTFGLELLLEQAKVLQQQQKKEQETEHAQKTDAVASQTSPYRPLLLSTLAGPTAAPPSFFSISSLLAPRQVTATMPGSHLDLLAHRSPITRRSVNPNPPTTLPLYTNDHSQTLPPIASPLSHSSTSSFENQEDDDDDGSLSTTSSSIETASDVDLLHASLLEEVNSEDGDHVVLALLAAGRPASATAVGGKRRFGEMNGGAVEGTARGKHAMAGQGVKRQKTASIPDRPIMPQPAGSFAPRWLI